MAGCSSTVFRVTVTSRCAPSEDSTVSTTWVPASPLMRVAPSRWFSPVSSVPSTATIRSPAVRPASSAGPPSVTDWMSMPPSSG